MNNQSRLKNALMILGISSLLWTLSPSAEAHVRVQSPNGGEVLDVGSVITISWQILISHNLMNWDLWYSTTGSTGPWIPIATDLAPGSASAGSIHTYNWTVPDAVSSQVRVRVRMDNSGVDYFDFSNGDLTIQSPPPTCCMGLSGNIDGDPADIVDITDLTVLIDHLFINFPLLDCPEEGNVDGDLAGLVDITDLTFLIDHLFINFPPTAACQ